MSSSNAMITSLNFSITSLSLRTTRSPALRSLGTPTCSLLDRFSLCLPRWDLPNEGTLCRFVQERKGAVCIQSSVFRTDRSETSMVVRDSRAEPVQTSKTMKQILVIGLTEQSDRSDQSIEGGSK